MLHVSETRSGMIECIDLRETGQHSREDPKSYLMHDLRETGQHSVEDLICNFLLLPIPIVYWALAYFDPSIFFSSAALRCILAASTLLCSTDKNTYMG
jgi:hypothetical protein